MNPIERNIERELPPDLVAEAAAWVAVLHGPNRTSATEQGFVQWLKRSADNARAFEEATSIWEESRRLPRPASIRAANKPARNGFRRAGLLAAAAVAALTIATILHVRTTGVTTGRGEQRLLVLEDGSNVTLNTDTRVVVKYDERGRTVELKEGEALFEVAKHPNWPFFVIAGDRKIMALGTSFAVRRYDDGVAVTLVEGKVTVTPLKPLAAEQAAGVTQPASVVMAPGERLVFAQAKLAKADRPPLAKVLAWQRREVALDNAYLADAIAEMNRYSRKPLTAPITHADSIRVTGLFRAGDSMSFAKAVATAYQLDIVETDDEIRLIERHASASSDSN